MLNPVYVERLKDEGILHLRHLSNDETPGVISWQNVLQMKNKKDAETKIRSLGMDWQWIDGDRLRLLYKLDAFTFHPETGEELWFNQVHSHHASYYKAHPDFQNKNMDDRDYPFHSQYGDGEEIEEEFLQQLREAGWKSAVGFPWQQGDLMFLDNMVAQHARLSYTGNRKILVGLSSPRIGQSHHGRLAAS